ncbi:MAG: amidase [Chloroflexi bacterium]|nr:amidase [Chloroflexota bacterium]
MTTMTDVCMLSLEDLAHKIAFKEISPVEVTEAMLARIERLNPALNAYMTVTADLALAQAGAAEKEIASGAYRGLLHGVPIAHKDLYDTKGVRTTAGSKIMADRVPDADATAVRKMSEAGAITLGKLGLHEFAFGGTSDNPHYGTIRNPWDTNRCPAGSSGGSGAAVAAGLAFAATGSDTGGSIRMPASFCGTVGLMPTYGRASLYGAIPLSWTLDHPGPLTRTVRDAAVVMQAISGRDPLDPVTEDREVPDFLDGIEAGAKGLRIGVPKQYFWDGCAADQRDAVRTAVAALEAAGAGVKEVDFAQVEAYMQAALAIIVVDAAAYHQPTFPSRRDEYGADVAALLDVGQNIPAHVFASAMRTLAAARGGEADAVLDAHGVDVLAVPTSPMTAPTVEEARDPAIGGRHHIFTMPFDVTGQPVVAVPAGLTPAGLPASISFVGRRWDEAAALRAARAWEQVRGPFPSPAIASQA